MASALRSALAADAAAIERAALSSCVTESDAKHFVEVAFKDPLEFKGPLTTIPKATLVVGAGKLERAKYSDELLKWVTTALRDLKFVEDRGASALPDCAGTFKFQHDTGKNEKFVHVFPFVNIVQPEHDETETENVEEDVTGIEKAKWMCIISNPSTFKEMVQSKIGSWSCKKRVLSLLKEKSDVLQDIEQKLTKRLALTTEEQKLFDATDQQNLEEKMQYLRGEMVKMIDEDKLTKLERTAALEQVKARIQELEQNGGKNIDSVKQRAEAVEKRLSDKGYHIPLKNEEKMKQLWRKTLSLQKLEEKAGPKGRWNTSLTPAEVKALGEKEEWDAELDVLGNASRFWFEEDQELALRITQAKATVKGSAGGSAASAKTTTVSKPSTSSTIKQSTTTNGWSTVGKSSVKSTSSATAKKPISKGNAFAGLDDSDSD